MMKGVPIFISTLKFAFAYQSSYSFLPGQIMASTSHSPTQVYLFLNIFPTWKIPLLLPLIWMVTSFLFLLPLFFWKKAIACARKLFHLMRARMSTTSPSYIIVNRNLGDQMPYIWTIKSHMKIFNNKFYKLRIFEYFQKNMQISTN